MIAGLTVLVWRSTLSAPLRSATLLSGTLVAVPLALVYDALIPLVAIVWLLREARDRGYLPYEQLVLFLIDPAALVPVPIAASWDVLLGPTVTCAILILCFRRVWQALAMQRDTMVAAAVAA
jgi:hypothetical protein